MVDQDILNCLDHALSIRHRAARVDATTMVEGLRAWTAQFERRATLVVNRVARHLPSHARLAAHVFFCEDERFGAFAIHDQYDYVILNLGLVPTLTHFFQCMMATPGLWPNFGEHGSAPIDEMRFTTEPIPAHSAWRVLPLRVPTDPARGALAVVFMSECFDLIVRHEFAHLVLGHATEDIRHLAGVDPIASQALEFAADGHAAIWGLDPLRHISKTLDRFPQSEVVKGYREFHRTLDDAMLNYLLAMFFVFRIMDEVSWSNDTLGTRQHPPAPMRFHTACIHLVEHFEQSGDSVAKARLVSAMQEIWELGEIIFAATLGKQPDHLVKDRTLSEEIERHYNLVSERAGDLPRHLFGLAP